MTVAAVILAARPASALAEADGVPTVRRLADVAWSGGATPIVVVSADPEGTVAAALTGASVTLAEPAPPAGGPAAQIHRGIEVAIEAIHDTSAALVWPARLVWVGAETVTSLIEAHGLDSGAALRPTYGGVAGWPVLLPSAALDALRATAPGLLPDAIVDDLVARGLPLREVELGDPGTIYDRDTPSADLPPYQGPPEPPAARAHEWGAAIADQPEDVPLEGPALAPYDQAEASPGA